MGTLPGVTFGARREVATSDAAARCIDLQGKKGPGKVERGRGTGKGIGRGRRRRTPGNLRDRHSRLEEGGGGVSLATGVCQLRHDQMEQGPTEPRTGRSTFLLSSGGAGAGYY